MFSAASAYSGRRKKESGKKEKPYFYFKRIADDNFNSVTVCPSKPTVELNQTCHLFAYISCLRQKIIDMRLMLYPKKIILKNLHKINCYEIRSAKIERKKKIVLDEHVLVNSICNLNTLFAKMRHSVLLARFYHNPLEQLMKPYLRQFIDV
uniref:Uncharacterized protein n=1 Tax=Cucumis melo TaxID=3656 RepID=A0A9I9EFX2_CUCME